MRCVLTPGDSARLSDSRNSGQGGFALLGYVDCTCELLVLELRNDFDPCPQADIAGVKNQLEERARDAEAAKEAARRDAEEDEAIRRYLMQVESEDALARRREMLALRNDWVLQGALNDEARAREAAERARGVDPEVCAPGAAQKFVGEDVTRLERMRLQALQRAQWAREQGCEKEVRGRQEQQQRDEEAAYTLEIARLQQELHEASESERARVAADLQHFNQLLLDSQRVARSREREREHQQNASEIAFTLASNLVSENPRQADRDGPGSGDPFGQRVRVDHWKGLSGSQTKQLLTENDLLLAEKARRAEQQRLQEEEDARRAADLHRALTAQERDAQIRRTQHELELQQTRARQAAEAAAREQRDAERARGAIDPGFFRNFGRSYR